MAYQSDVVRRSDCGGGTRQRLDVQTIDTTQRRRQILTADAIDTWYGRPTFTPGERRYYFALSQPEQEALQEFRTVKAPGMFIWQLSYCKAQPVFVPGELTETHEDLADILASYFPTTSLADRRPLNKRTRLKQPHLILALCNYRSWDAHARQQRAAKARHAAMVSAQPGYIGQALLHDLDEHRIVAPGYRLLQALVSTALTAAHRRVTTMVRHARTPADTAAFEYLLEEGTGLYTLTQLKREPKDCSAGTMQHERQRGEQLQGLYRVAQQVLPQLTISPESIKYYASLVMYYAVYRLKRLDVWLRCLYLLCFVYHRSQRCHAHLLERLMHHVRQYMDTTQAAAKEQGYPARLEGHEHLVKAGQVLKLFPDERIAPQTPFQDVQATACGSLARQTLAMIADHITTRGHFDDTAVQWAHIDALALQCKRHLRPVVLAVDLAAPIPHHPLLEAIALLQTVWRQGRSLSQQPAATFPLRWLPAKMKRYLYAQEPPDPKRLRPDRDEFLVYLLLRRRLESGDICCRASVRFRSFEDERLEEQRWQAQDTLIADTGLLLLQQPMEEPLAGLEQHLERRLAEGQSADGLRGECVGPEHPPRAAGPVDRPVSPGA